MKRVFIIAVLIFLVACKLIGQAEGSKLINRKSAGVLTEYGLPYYFLPEGDKRYHVLLLGGTYGFPLFRTDKVFNMSLEFFPHAGIVFVKSDRYFEVGINVRLGFNFSLSPNDVISFKLASGPHYVTVETEKQAKGFIFSDYYLVAYRRGFNISKKNYALDFEFGYRHISNAGLQEPNRSISNFIFGFGFMRSF